MKVETIGETTVLFYPEAGPRLATEADAVDVIGAGFESSAQVIAVSVGRFDDMFFHLSTRMAGEFIQKFVTYRIRLAILGDISAHTSTSGALRAFVHESNRRDEVWFLADEDALRARLSA